MRLNKFIADNTPLSRRKADTAIENGRVKINKAVATLGSEVKPADTVSLDGINIKTASLSSTTTLLLHKPLGYVCSRNGQGSPTVYDLFPSKFHHLNIAGRLDKDSTGLVILTDDGKLLHELTHPSNNKEKVYEVTINKSLKPLDLLSLHKGVDIGDSRLSSFKKIEQMSSKKYKIVLEEGRNRQIRRTFEKLDFQVITLRRHSLAHYNLGALQERKYSILKNL